MATDVNITNSSVPVDNASGQTVAVTVDNASIPVTSASTLNVDIQDTSVNTRPSVANVAKVSNTYTSAQTTGTSLVAASAGTQLIVTDLVFSNGATAGDFILQDTTPTTLLEKTYLAANGGIVLNLTCPIVVTADLGLQFTSTTVTTHTITVFYYTVS